MYAVIKQEFFMNGLEYKMENEMNNVSDMGVEIGSRAWKALLEEVYTTPKPGLVDIRSSGAHTDMDVTTFEKSADALKQYLIRIADQGYRMDCSPEELFVEARKTGVAAERAMFAATGGVNTHKGLVFTLGILCAAAGRCEKEYGRITARELMDVEQKMVRKILGEELRTIEGGRASDGARICSNGERNLQEYGTTGIRGEAMLGYPSVWKYALPTLRDGIRRQQTWNRVKLQTLLVLMANVEDSNVLSRQDPETLVWMQEQARSFLNDGGAYAPEALDRMRKLDEEFIRRNISPGGCADLLAMTVFLELILNE